MEQLQFQCELNGEKFVRPKLDVPTGWNGTFDMLSSIISRLRPVDPWVQIPQPTV